MLCWASIMQPDGNGPPAGTLLMARDLDPMALRRIGERTRMAFELRPAESGAVSGSETWSFDPPQFMQSTVIHAQRFDTDISLAYELKDVLGRPLGTIHMTTPRSLMESGRLLVASTAAQLPLTSICTLSATRL